MNSFDSKCMKVTFDLIITNNEKHTQFGYSIVKLIPWLKSISSKGRGKCLYLRVIIVMFDCSKSILIVLGF